MVWFKKIVQQLLKNNIADPEIKLVLTWAVFSVKREISRKNQYVISKQQQAKLEDSWILF